MTDILIMIIILKLYISTKFGKCQTVPMTTNCPTLAYLVMLFILQLVCSRRKTNIYKWANSVYYCARNMEFSSTDVEQFQSQLVRWDQFPTVVT